MAAENLPPVMVAAFPGPPLNPHLASWEGVIAVTGISPGAGEEGEQSVSLVAHALDPQVIEVLGVDHAGGGATATVRTRLASPSVPVASSRILITAFDDGEPMGIATVIVDVALVPTNTAPYLYRLEPRRISPGRLYPFSNFQMLAMDREDDPITYTVQDLPRLGALSLYVPLTGSRRLLAPGDTYTQEDVDERRVGYTPLDGVTEGIDGFTFTIADPYSGPSATAYTMVAYIGDSDLLLSVSSSTPVPVWTEGDPPAPIAPAVSITGASDDLAGGQLVLSPGGGWHAGDRLDLADQGLGAGQVGLAGASVLVGGVAIGTWSAAAEGTLAITFNAAATLVAARTVLRAVLFSHAGEDPGEGTRSVRIELSDGHGGVAAPVSALIPVWPVDDQPLLVARQVAIPQEVATVVQLAASDPDSAVLSWSLLAGVPEIVVTPLGGGAFRLAAQAPATGRQVLRFQVDDGATATAGEVEVLISGPADARPQPAGDAPREAFAGSEVDFDLPWDVSDLGISTGLVFSASADAPAGLVLDRTGDHRVRVSWPVPADEVQQTHRRFSIIAQDQDGRGAGCMPVSLWIRPQPQGGG